MMKTDWEKITEDAFASDEEHIFSEGYCRRRAELQGGITMEKKREKTRNRRFNAGMAATAAAFILIPTVTIGAIRFASDGKKDNSSKLGAAVADTSYAEEATSATTETEIATEATSTGIISQEPVVIQNYGEKQDFVYIEYDINYDNVPAIFNSPDGFKFHLNDGQYHAGGITPGGIGRYSDFEGYKNLLFTGMDMDYDNIEEYTINNEGMEWKVYVGHRSDSTLDYDNDGVVDEAWQNGSFDRDVVIRFGDTDYAGFLCVHSDITAENLKAFIEGMRLVKLDEPVCVYYESAYQTQYDAVDGCRINDGCGEAQIEYYYVPEGYDTGIELYGGSVYNGFEFVKNEDETIDPYFAMYGNEDDFDYYAHRIFDSNAVSRNGKIQIINDDKDPEQHKTIYVNHRNEGPCEGEDEEGWKLRRETDWYDRDIVVRFDETGYAVSFCVYHDISDEELMQFIDNMKLVLTNDEV